LLPTYDMAKPTQRFKGESGDPVDQQHETSGMANGQEESEDTTEAAKRKEYDFIKHVHNFPQELFDIIFEEFSAHPVPKYETIEVGPYSKHKPPAALQVNRTFRAGFI
jgi:hypothetical protein